MEVSSRLQRLLPHLRKRFTSQTGADGLFPILTKRQTQNAWASIPELEFSRPREAAILVPIIELRDEIHLVFTKRSSNLRSHGAEISFPGGGREDGDTTLIDTALRETREELLHPLDFSWETIGECGVVPSLRGIPVTPVLAVHTSSLSSIEDVFPGCPHEVDKVFTVGLRALIEEESSEPLGRLGTPAPVFMVGDDEIWGLTAFVLRPILHNLLKPVFLDRVAGVED